VGTIEKTTLFQKPESFGQERTFTFKLFSKGLINTLRTGLLNCLNALPGV
jgi:hypothetical protein